MIFWATVAVDPLHIGQTCALASGLVTASPDSIISVTGTLLTSIGAEVPISIDTVLALLSSDTVLANALARCLCIIVDDNKQTNRTKGEKNTTWSHWPCSLASEHSQAKQPVPLAKPQ